MANNFTAWLGNLATSTQQDHYNKILSKGFEPGGFVKAEDFNAVLRMTTLVCSGIANVFGFNSQTIDVSEDTITNAIQDASITLGNINVGNITSRSGINTSTINTAFLTIGNNTIIDNNRNITATTINGTDITADGILKGKSLNINDVAQIDSDGNVTGKSLTVNSTSITSLGYNAGGLQVIDNAGNISAESISSKTITVTGTLKGNSLDINGRGISSQGVINGDSLKINSVEMIDSSRNINYAGTINAVDNITTAANITASGVLKGTSLEAGRIDGIYMHIGPTTGTTNLSINSSGVLTANGFINTNSSIRTNGVERITNTGIIYPTKLNLQTISNCAYMGSNSDVDIKISKGAGTTGDYVHFGAKIPNLPYSTAEAQKQILLACISIEATSAETTNHKFNSVYTAILTGYPNSNQGSTIFDVYSGNGTVIGDSWGQIRISYQPYSWFSTSNPVAPSCYIAYKKNINFNDIVTAIHVELYPIGTFS